MADTTRRSYQMTEEQHKRLLSACKPVPYIVVGGMPPRSQQENANAAWRVLGEELGFDWETVMPDPAKGDRFFTAVPVPPAPEAA